MTFSLTRTKGGEYNLYFNNERIASDIIGGQILQLQHLLKFDSGIKNLGDSADTIRNLEFINWRGVCRCIEEIDRQTLASSLGEETIKCIERTVANGISLNRD